jgi:Tol biopolymer transport system component
VDVESGGVKPAILSDDLNQVGWPRWISSETVAYQNRADPSIVARNLRNGTETTLATIKSLGVDRLTPGMQGTPFGISPDGRLLAFSGWIGSGANAYTVIRVMALGGVPTEIVRGPDGSAPKAFFFQAWTPDGLDLLFTKQEQDRRYSLWRISAQGGTPQPLGLEMNGLRDVHLSSDGTHLTFTVGSQVGDVRVMENFLPR